MATDHNVRIIEWPKNKALLEHHFVLDKPCPVGIVFDEKPAFVELSSNPTKPMFVDMNMKLIAERAIPLCIKFCEPICAKSDYQIGINLLGRPLAQITVRGTTRIGPCDDKGTPPKEKTCLDFSTIKPGDSRDNPFKQGIGTFKSLGDATNFQFVTPDSTGEVMLLLSSPGISVDFDTPVDNLDFNLFNVGNPVVEIIALSGGSLVHQVAENFTGATTRLISVNKTGISRLEIHISKNNRAALGRLCYELSDAPTTTNPAISIIK